MPIVYPQQPRRGSQLGVGKGAADFLNAFLGRRAENRRRQESERARQENLRLKLILGDFEPLRDLEERPALAPTGRAPAKPAPVRPADVRAKTRIRDRALPRISERGQRLERRRSAEETAARQGRKIINIPGLGRWLTPRGEAKGRTEEEKEIHKMRKAGWIDYHPRIHAEKSWPEMRKAGEGVEIGGKFLVRPKEDELDEMSDMEKEELKLKVKGWREHNKEAHGLLANIEAERKLKFNKKDWVKSEEMPEKPKELTINQATKELRARFGAIDKHGYISIKEGEPRITHRHAQRNLIKLMRSGVKPSEAVNQAEKEAIENAKLREIKTPKLEKSVRTKIQTEITDINIRLAGLEEMQRLFKDHPEYLTYPGRLGSWAVKFADKLGLSHGESKKWMQGRQSWYITTQEQFFRYRKWVTGVAGGQAEMSSIAKAYPDAEKNSPAEYEANLAQAIKIQKMYKDEYVRLLKEGKEFTQAMQREFWYKKADPVHWQKKARPKVKPEKIKPTKIEPTKIKSKYKVGDRRTITRGGRKIPIIVTGHYPGGQPIWEVE